MYTYTSYYIEKNFFVYFFVNWLRQTGKNGYKTTTTTELSKDRLPHVSSAIVDVNKLVRF